MVERTPAVMRSSESIVTDFERAAGCLVERSEHDRQWTSNETLRLLKRLHAEVVDLRKEVDALSKI